MAVKRHWQGTEALKINKHQVQMLQSGALQIIFQKHSAI